MSDLNFRLEEVILLAISLASALGYGLIWLRAGPGLTRAAVKSAAILSLAALSWIMGGPFALTLALALSAIGDAALTREGDRAFLVGLSAFFTAHVAYLWLFRTSFGDARVEVMALGALYAAAMLRWLWPHLGALRWAVTAYVAVIWAMAAAASGAPAALWPIWVGVALFLISDSVLAAELFPFRAAPRRWTAPVIWPTYYVSQVLIAAAFLCPHFTKT